MIHKIAVCPRGQVFSAQFSAALLMMVAQTHKVSNIEEPSGSHFRLLRSLIKDLIDISEEEVKARHYDLLLCKGYCYG